MGDLSFSARTLRKNLGFSAVAVLTLALGSGANTAIFSVVKAVLLNQLPYRQPERLVTVAEGDPGDVKPETVDFTTTWDWRARSRSFTSMSLYRAASAAIAEGSEPELLRGLRVNYDFFDTLGVRMYLGRGFLPEEDRPDTRREIILSHGLWTRRFGANRHIVGRVLRLSESSCTVVGVLPADYRPLATDGGSDAPEMYMPLGYALAERDACRGCQHLRLVARLKPGVAVATARAELNTIMRDIVREHPADYKHDAAVMVAPLRDQLVGRVETALWVLLGAVGFVLLIACANVANLLLARATGRSRELAVRAALGAGGWRIARQLLTESLLLSLAGGAAGVLLAVWGTAALASLGPRQIPRVNEIRIDGTVLAFAFAVSLAAGVLFGLAPAWRASRIDLNEALKGLGKSTEGRARHGLRNALVTAELALAFVLVVGAGLLGKSFLRLMQVDPGYDPHNVLTLATYVYGARYQKPEMELNYYQQAMDRLRATPGIEGVAMVSTLPLADFDRRGFHIEDRRLANESEAPFADAYSVSPDYFQVMKIPLKRGRLFTAQDGPGAAHVAVISESCARAQFPGRDPIGKHIQLGGREEKKPWLTIVGVVGDVRQYGLDRASEMEAYIAQAQDLSFGYSMVARTTLDPRRLERTVRAAFLAVDKTQPVFRVQPMESYVAATLAERTFTLALLGLFGALALALAAVGIYGVVSYTVSLRTREVGIRMALGAGRRDVLGMVLRQGLALVGMGLAAGFAASLALTRLLASLLFEVRPTDVTTSAAVAVVLAAVALLASYLPAHRAAKVDPMVALRWE
ncbi:MAG: ABC transporter permease [Acidobacteriia bacterium]|nr:ABC transporter permease [Terriglobia bacterium]